MWLHALSLMAVMLAARVGGLEQLVADIAKGNLYIVSYVRA
jgi:hypothetical protein